MELEEYINLRREEVITEDYDFIIDFLIEDKNRPLLERLWEAMEYQIMDVDISQQIWKNINNLVEEESEQSIHPGIKQRVA